MEPETRGQKPASSCSLFSRIHFACEGNSYVCIVCVPMGVHVCYQHSPLVFILSNLFINPNHCKPCHDTCRYNNNDIGEIPSYAFLII